MIDPLSVLKSIQTISERDLSDNFWRAIVNDVYVDDDRQRKVQVTRLEQNNPDPTYYRVVSSPMPVAGDDVWMYNPGGEPAFCIGIAIPKMRFSTQQLVSADVNVSGTSRTSLTGLGYTGLPLGEYTVHLFLDVLQMSSSSGTFTGRVGVGTTLNGATASPGSAQFVSSWGSRGSIANSWHISNTTAGNNLYAWGAVSASGNSFKVYQSHSSMIIERLL